MPLGMNTPCSQYLWPAKRCRHPVQPGPAPRERASLRSRGQTPRQGWQAVDPAQKLPVPEGKQTVLEQRRRRAPCCPAAASRGRVAGEEIEVPAQGAAVLRHLLAAVELRARGVALTLLDKSVHLQRQKRRSKV